MARIRGVPHAFPYQGSKRQLASYIISCIPSKTKRLIEPFAGSAAITVAAAQLDLAKSFYINDIHKPLIRLWDDIISNPKKLLAGYRKLWTEQAGQERVFYDEVRDHFNKTHDSDSFLYLLARCVKAAIRYNGKGEFNNSPDNRRKGMHPDLMESNLLFISEILKGHTIVSCKDYREVLGNADKNDVVYMDPPYQGVCGTHNHRYCQGIEFEEFVNTLKQLNDKSISYILSYDGRLGQKEYGRPLPLELGLFKKEIVVGRSTQATLLGRNHNTIENLYLSPGLLSRLGKTPAALREQPQTYLFA